MPLREICSSSDGGAGGAGVAGVVAVGRLLNEAGGGRLVQTVDHAGLAVVGHLTVFLVVLVFH